MFKIMKKVVLMVMMMVAMVVVVACTPKTQNTDADQMSGSVTDTGSVASGAVENDEEVVVEDGTNVIDVENSLVTRKGKKVTGEHYGRVTIASGEVVVADGMPSEGVIVMDMTTITVDDQKENDAVLNHLKSDDFFNVETNPTSTMVIKSFEAVEGEDNTYTATADLTIKGITNEVTFPATFSDDLSSATATIQIDRTLRDIKFRSAKFFNDLKDSAIDDVFTLDIEVSFE